MRIFSPSRFPEAGFKMIVEGEILIGFGRVEKRNMRERDKEEAPLNGISVALLTRKNGLKESSSEAYNGCSPSRISLLVSVRVFLESIGQDEA